MSFSIQLVLIPGYFDISFYCVRQSQKQHKLKTQSLSNRRPGKANSLFQISITLVAFTITERDIWLEDCSNQHNVFVHRRQILLYCIVFEHFFSAPLSSKPTETLLVWLAPRKETFLEENKDVGKLEDKIHVDCRSTNWKRKAIPRRRVNDGKGTRLSHSCHGPLGKEVRLSRERKWRRDEVEIIGRMLSRRYL